MRFGPRGSTSLLLASLSLAAATGCANHPANNTYGYSPPYAPPVYPQPQGYAQPAGYTVPAGALPPGAVMAPGTVVSSPAGVVTPGTVVGAPVMVDAGGQTPPCPPTYTP